MENFAIFVKKAAKLKGKGVGDEASVCPACALDLKRQGKRVTIPSYQKLLAWAQYLIDVICLEHNIQTPIVVSLATPSTSTHTSDLEPIATSTPRNRTAVFGWELKLTNSVNTKSVTASSLDNMKGMKGLSKIKKVL